MDRHERFIVHPGDLQKLWPVDEIAEIMDLTPEAVYALAQEYDAKIQHVAGKDFIINDDFERMKGGMT